MKPKAKPTHEEAREIVLLLFRQRAPRPILVGEAAIVLGPHWSLTATEGLFLWLALKGFIRPATSDERQRFDMRTGWMV